MKIGKGDWWATRRLPPVGGCRDEKNILIFGVWWGEGGQRGWRQKEGEKKPLK